MNKEFQNTVILDLSTRLPGPLATSVLSNLGFRVIKPKLINDLDPFKDSIVPVFKYWNDNFSKNIELVDESLENIATNFKFAACVYTRSNYKQINELKMHIKHPCVFLELGASSDPNKKSLHDLNALALTTLLNAHLSSLLLTDEQKNGPIPPPFVPFAGVQFANSIALNLLSLIYKSQIKNEIIEHQLFLEDEIKKISQLLLPAENPGPHLFSGSTPCYMVYPLKPKNTYLAVAAIEEKYWIEFLSLINMLHLSSKRFDTDKKIIKEVSQALRSIEIKQIENSNLINNCLTIFKF